MKRTVREMPRRLTIRLSKGSNRNMVEDPGEANAPSPRMKRGLQISLSDSTSLGQEASSQRKTNSIPKFNHWTACMESVRAGSRGHERPLQTPGSVFSTSTGVQAAAVTASSEGGISVRSPHAASTSFTFSPAQEHLAHKSVLKSCHCQKYQEEFNLVPEKS